MYRMAAGESCCGETNGGVIGSVIGGGENGENSSNKAGWRQAGE